MSHIHLFFSNESIPNSETTGYCSGTVSNSSTPEKPSAKTAELTHSTERILSMRPSNSPPLPAVADEDKGDILSRFPFVEKKHSSVRTSPNRPSTSPELRPSSNIFSHITNQQSGTIQSPILGSSPPSVGSSFGQFGHLGSSASAGGAPGLGGFGLGHLGQNLGLSGISPSNPSPALHAFQIQQFLMMQQRLANATLLGQMNPNLLRVSFSPLIHFLFFIIYDSY